MKFLEDLNEFLNEERLDQLYFKSNRIKNVGHHRFEFIDYNKMTNTLTFRVDRKYNIDILLLNDNIKTYDDVLLSDVKVHCECNDFRFVFAYWAYKNGFGIKKELRPSDIKNPYGDGTICKHITALSHDIDSFEGEIGDELKIYDIPDIETTYKDVVNKRKETEKTKDIKYTKPIINKKQPIIKQKSKYSKDWMKDFKKDNYDFSDYEDDTTI